MRLVLALLLMLSTPARSQEAPVEQLHAALLSVMRAGPELSTAERADLLAPVLADAFDLPAMTRTAIGPEAQRMGADELARLTEAFGRYIATDHARRFSTWNGERFETGTPVPAHGGGMLVPTRMVPASGEPARLAYLVRESGGEWRVADILLDGTASQVAARRVEFQSALRQGGASELLDLIERRVAALSPS